MGERRPKEPDVAGSSPACGTNNNLFLRYLHKLQQLNPNLLFN